MNRPEPDVGEFEDSGDAYLANDEIPDTLVAVLKHLAIDYVPETRAACECINAWLAEHDGMPAGTTAARGVGDASFDLRGIPITAMAQPFRFHVLKRVQDEFEALPGPQRSDVRKLLDACDMVAVLDFKLSRGIGRANNLEVWL